MSLYESFLKEAVETLQIVKDELKNDPVSSIEFDQTVRHFFPNRLSNLLPHRQLQHRVKTTKNYPMVFGFIVTSPGFVYLK